MAKAELIDGEVQVDVDWREQKLIEQVPGLSYRSKDKLWRGPPSWALCQILRGVFGDKLHVGSALREWAVHERTWIDENLRLRELIADPSLTSTDDRLYDYQVVGSQFMFNADALICDEMGTGKSVTTLSALTRREMRGLPAIIICPNSVKRHWAHEAEVWAPQVTPYVIGGGAAQRRKLLKSAAEDPSALVIINYESVRLHSRLAPYGSVRLVKCRSCGGYGDEVPISKCQRHSKELNELEFKTVIVDEAHRMKDPKSQQTRACWAVQHGDAVERRWALTGTPIANDVGDLWSILHGIAPREFPSKTKFIERFALLAWNPFAALDIVGVKPVTRPEFDRIVLPRLRRVLKEVVLPDLPPKVYVTREAPMTTKQAKAYRQMEVEMIAELDDDQVLVSPTNLTKATRLMQFASAYTEVLEDDSLRLTEPSPKVDVLLEVLAELGERQVAVCAMSRQLIELAAARLDEQRPPITYRLLTGKVPEHERARNLADFQAGRARCMLFTIQAGGVGVSMTAADTIVRLQRSWSLVDNAQVVDRVHRVGSEQHESITVIDVVAPETIEEHQFDTLDEKAGQFEDVVQDRARLERGTVDTQPSGRG